LLLKKITEFVIIKTCIDHRFKHVCLPIFVAVTNTTFSHVTQTRKHQLAIGRFAHSDAPSGSHDLNRHCTPPHHAPYASSPFNSLVLMNQYHDWYLH